ncbi:MAG: DNA polymerase III subunit epsilon [Meiothermus sp.]
MSPTHYRLATRIARRLRQEGRSLPKAGLAEEILASRGAWATRLLEDLLDGRFEQAPQEVGLWEWRNPFPPQGKPVVVLDLETTGLSALENEIIEIALIRLEGDRREVFQRLVDPGGPLPPWITRLTGITRRDLEGAPDVYTVLEEAWPLLEDATLIIQNAPFDLGFLRPRFLRLGYKMDNEVIDTVAWARRALPGLSKRGLDHLAWAFDLDTIVSRHRALGDVEATLRVAKEMYYMLTAGKPLALGDV